LFYKTKRENQKKKSGEWLNKESQTRFLGLSSLSLNRWAIKNKTKNVACVKPINNCIPSVYFTFYSSAI